MLAPPIDQRRRSDLVAWTELLARCDRARPEPGLLGAVVARDVVDPGAKLPQVVVAAGTVVVADKDDNVLAKLAGLAWLDVAGLLAGQPQRTDIVHPANQHVYRAGPVIDPERAGLFAELARIAGPEILTGLTIAQPLTDHADDHHVYKAGTIIDAGLAAAIDRLAWVRVQSWQPAPGGGSDVGRALIGIAGHFAELVVERINRAAEKHELAFLNLTGAQPLPPRPARVPLTFALATGSPVEAVVAAGTQVTASPLEGEENEVVFETDRSLVVTPVQLEAVYVDDAETDRYSIRSEEATGRLDQPFPAFDGDKPTPHQLFVACDQLLTPPGTKNVTVLLKSTDLQWQTWPVSWSYWDGTDWRATPSQPTVANGVWSVALANLPPPVPCEVGGRTAGWLRAQLDMPLPAGRAGVAPESVAVGNRLPRDLELPLAPFGETSPPAKFFYLSLDVAVGAGRQLVRLKVALARKGLAIGRVFNWTYRLGEEWRSLGQTNLTAAPPPGDFAFRDGTNGFSRDGDITFYAPAVWPRTQFHNRVGRWLRVEVAEDNPGAATSLPSISRLEASSTWELPQIGAVSVRLSAVPQAQPPAAAAANSTALDVTKDFRPFGEEPEFNDTLYLALPEAYALAATTVRLKVVLTNPSKSATKTPKEVLATGGATLAWEAWDGRTWRPCTVDDKTTSFTLTGDVTVKLPETLVPTEVNGVEGRWLRVRLTSGHYGLPADYTPGTDKAGNVIYTLEKATYAPPVVKTLLVEPVTAQLPEAQASACLTYNDFGYVDRLAAASGRAGSFAPFTTGVEQVPSLYLGFDQPFDPRPVTLYLQVEPPPPEAVAADQLAAIDVTTLAQVTWEYAGPDGWRPLGALDETDALARRGLVSFVGPDDLTQRTCFGRSSYWLRLRWPRGYFPLPPRLRRILVNTTWATQVVSVTDEILGSSNGNPNQTFTTAQNPVQPGQQLLVREREQPPPEEWAALVALEGDDAIQIVLDPAGQPDEVWARWHAVVDFYASGPHDRHYTLDPLTGEVSFGDGQRGLIPPPGQNNIRTSYRTGGGEQGNRAPDTVVQLSSGIAYVDSVTNHEAAQGGAAREPIERLRERGPRALRHRDRAVTAQDVEDLAYEASTDVARAAAVSPFFDPNNLWLDPGEAISDDHRAAAIGRMGVIVVPASVAARPTPSLGLIADVQAYLEQRCPPTAELWVAGPEWVRVTVTATVVPKTLEVADAAGVRTRAALERFLHPLTGGPHGQGWAFGRKPHRSDLYALIEGVDGVDHVVTLTIAHLPETQDPNRQAALQRLLDQSLGGAGNQDPTTDQKRWLDRALVYSGAHRITVALAR